MTYNGKVESSLTKDRVRFSVEKYGHIYFWRLQVRDPGMAEDIAQGMFMMLTQAFWLLS
jgi:hypothetical protein